MTITIQKTGKTSATITVDGRDYFATLDTSMHRWVVQTDSGPRTTTSPKVKSLAAIFAPINISGAAPKRRFPSRPRAPRAPRTPGTGPKRGPVFATPKPTSEGLMLVALAALEDFLVVKLRDARTVTPEQQKSYERYTKFKALALGPTSSTAAQNEARSALGAAARELIKLVF